MLLPSRATVIALAATAAVAAAFAAGWTAQGWRADAALAQLRTEYATAQHRALETAHANTLRLQDTADAAARQQAARTQTLARAADALRAERDGLRHDLATAASLRVPSTAPAASPDHAAAAAELLAECAGAVADLAIKADGHASDARALSEAWPR